MSHPRYIFTDKQKWGNLNKCGGYIQHICHCYVQMVDQATIFAQRFVNVESGQMWNKQCTNLH